MAIVTGSRAPPPAPWIARPATMARQVRRDGADDRSDEKKRQRSLKCQRPADEVGEPADDRNGHDVGEEVAVDDPDVAVDVGGVDAQIGHHPGQDRGDDREIEGAEKDGQERDADSTTVSVRSMDTAALGSRGRRRRLRPAARSRRLRRGATGSASRRRDSAAPVPEAPRAARAAGHASPDRSRGRPSPVTR